MARANRTDPKIEALQESKTLNQRSGQVRDRQFLEQAFFDSRDLAQVKYEMLRRVQKEGAAVRETAAAFGFSRPTFYKVQEDFAREGLAGLIPRKRGPKGRRKLGADIMEFVGRARAEEPPITSAVLIDRIRAKFGVAVHRRSLERAMAALKKKTPVETEPMDVIALAEHYENIRGQALGQGNGPRWGQALLMDRGLAGWMKAVGRFVAPSSTASSTPTAATMPIFGRRDEELFRLIGEAILATAKAS